MLPKPNATFVTENKTGPWTEEEARGLICNPIYAGLGPFPGILNDEEWVKSAAKAIANDGIEQFLVNLLHLLRQTFNGMEQE